METIDSNSLVGLYELSRVIAEVNGSWVNQNPIGGMCVFTANHQVLMQYSDFESARVSYQGSYLLKADRLEIQVKLSSIQEQEAKSIGLKILFLDSECLILETENSGRKSRLTFRKLAFLQPA